MHDPASVLRRSNEAASSWAMLRRITVFLMLFAFLLGGSGLPAVAHVHDELAGHAFEMVERSDRADAERQSPDTSRDLASHAGHHHHGAEALKIVLSEEMPARISASIERYSAQSQNLKSLSQAPPTEPPSA